jgi:predicted MFS family arabinose efflux permease
MMAVAMYFVESRTLIYGLQVTTGMAVTIFPPAIAAISLGLVGRNRLPERAGRNEACFHAGNVFAAAAAGAFSWVFGNIAVFFAVAIMAVASAISACLIREQEIDNQLARGADDHGGEPHIEPLTTVVKDPQILWFTAAVVLFHFGNAAMLPLVGQKVAHRTPETASTLMAACIIVAQVTMVPVALLASRAAVAGRRRVFLAGFAVLPVRGLLYTLTDSSVLLIANQILDGVGAGIFGVVAVLMMADLTRGTGRFNFAQGLVATAIGLGAAASNSLTGLVVTILGLMRGFYFCLASPQLRGVYSLFAFKKR